MGITCQICIKPPKIKGLCKTCYFREREKIPGRVAYKKSPEYTASRNEYYKKRYLSAAGKESIKKHQKTYKFKDSQKTFRMTIKARFSAGKRQALKRNVEWALTLYEYISIIKDICHYCNGPLSKFGLNLDRKDNDLSYNLNNVVTCCGDCNRTKGDRLTYNEMIAISNLLKEMRRT